MFHHPERSSEKSRNLDKLSKHLIEVEKSVLESEENENKYE